MQKSYNFAEAEDEVLCRTDFFFDEKFAEQI
jgi:hypothetical protein